MAVFLVFQVSAEMSHLHRAFLEGVCVYTHVCSVCMCVHVSMVCVHVCARMYGVNGGVKGCREELLQFAIRQLFHYFPVTVFL